MAIYKRRPVGDGGEASSSCRSNEVAEVYGVNSKTIRDIWNRVCVRVRACVCVCVCGRGVRRQLQDDSRHMEQGAAPCVCVCMCVCVCVCLVGVGVEQAVDWCAAHASCR